jgi:peptidylprolyl isomerase
MSTPPSRTQKRQRQKEGAQARRAAELAAARRQQRTRRIVRVAIFAVVAAALVVGMSVFGGKDKKDDTTASSTTSTSSTATTAAASDVKPPTCTGPDGSNTDLTKKPTVPVPDKKAAELTCRDLVVGTGKEVKPGDTVTVQYVGVSQSTGKQFDASWDRGGEAATFSLSGVIKGWTDGIPGMKVGGRRLLVIPGSQAYGAQGRGSDIGPDETLVFIVDVQDTKSA